jgi:2-dehydropantoate 2-reductase
VRIGIIGAGAVGSALGALLARAGHDVEVAARGATLEAIRDGGIRLDGGWGEATVRVTANPTLEEPAELVIITTKAQDAASAIEQNLAALTGALVFVVQNGLDGVGTARRLLPTTTVVGGLAMFAASFVSPGVVTITNPAVTYIGGDGAKLVADALGTAVPIEIVSDFPGAQWSKLVVNQLNALPAITGLSVQEVVANDALRRVLTAGMRETVRTGLAAGVTFASLNSLSHVRLRLFSVLPLAIAQALPRSMARAMGDVPNPGSTLQSIRRGQKTEIDYLNGAVVAAARAIGREAPINAALTALVHEVESSGSFLTPSEVVARVVV